MNILLIATAWGPKHGGINAFNRDFAIGLAAELGTSSRVFSTALDPTPEEIADARKSDVSLIPITSKASAAQFDPSWMSDVVDWLKANASTEISWCVGHDVISGEAAIHGAAITSSEVALIHHMSYLSYQGVKHDESVEAVSKHDSQRKLFRANAALFAVGPLLRDSCRELSGKDPVVLIPGFISVSKNTSSNERIAAITYGRMDAASDRVKQGRLAVAGFGEAAKLSDKAVPPTRAMRQSSLYVIGIDAKDAAEAEDIRSLAEKHAGRFVNVLPLPFDEDRSQLVERMAESNLAMMLSWHEGFGLTGWEAIAAGIPLIVSKQSGVYQLIDEVLGGAGLGCLQAIEIMGRRGSDGQPNYTEQDCINVATAILHAAADISRCKRDANNLRVMLSQELQCSWRDTARKFIGGLPSDRELSFTSSPQGTGLAILSLANQDSPIAVIASKNPVDGCAELILNTTQGSTTTSFDLLPELRFGREEFDIDGRHISCGIAEATLRVQLAGCRIAPGKRLGDDVHPYIATRGGNVWRLTGPKEGAALSRLALGSERICRIEADPESDVAVTVSVECRQSHIVHEYPDGEHGMELTRQRVLSVFLNKCLGASGGVVRLCEATIGTMSGKGDERAPNT